MSTYIVVVVVVVIIIIIIIVVVVVFVVVVFVVVIIAVVIIIVVVAAVAARFRKSTLRKLTIKCNCIFLLDQLRSLLILTTRETTGRQMFIQIEKFFWFHDGDTGRDISTWNDS